MHGPIYEHATLLRRPISEVWRVVFIVVSYVNGILSNDESINGRANNDSLTGQ